MRILYIGVVASALALVGMGCQTSAATDGAVIGGALGAGSGAIIGHQSGHAGEGAVIGAGIGALTGAIVGDAVGKPEPQPVYYQAPPQQPLPPPQSMGPAAGSGGYYENRIVRTPSGETYEERVWVPTN